MPQIRLLRVITDLQPGGVQRMLLRSLEGLVRHGARASVCCIGRERGGLVPSFEALGVAVHHLPFRGRLDPRGLWRLRELVERCGYNVVHGHMYPANIAVNLALARLRGVVIINGYHSQRPIHTSGQARMVRWTRRLPAAWVAVSEAVRTPLVGLGLPGHLVHVIPNGIDASAQPEPMPEVAPDAPLELFWSGRFVRHNRCDFMIAVVDECRRQGVPVRLTLVGEGPLQEKTAQRSAALGLGEWVRFVRPQADLRPRLAAAELFMTTSEREGFPNAIVEACAAGRGFLASDIPPHRELLADGSGAGLLLGEHPGEWAEAIHKLIRDRARVAALGGQAYRIGLRYTLEENARKTLGLYEHLLGTPGA